MPPQKRSPPPAGTGPRSVPVRPGRRWVLIAEMEWTSAGLPRRRAHGVRCKTAGLDVRRTVAYRILRDEAVAWLGEEPP
jgi:hypothetical protein